MTGIKYITDEKRHWTERLFWLVAMTLSISTCSYLIFQAYSKFNESPIIVSFSEKFKNIFEIPFPAVTICPIAGDHPLNQDYSLNNSSAENPLNNFIGSIETKIQVVMWRNDVEKSTRVFTEIATEEGFCYTFNMLRFQDLFEENV